jgi:hypothetical protein
MKTPGLAGALLWAALLLAPACQAGVYKWVDEKGVTHYTEEPPRGRSARSMSSPAPKPAETAPGETKSWQEKDAEFRVRQMEREQAEQAEKRNLEKKQQACAEARDQLRRMEAAGYLYRLDEKGERVALDDASQARSLEQARKRVQSYCS